ncbi:DUF2568 domain-containing protein [Streptococcus dentiloxodontae]
MKGFAIFISFVVETLTVFGLMVVVLVKISLSEKYFFWLLGLVLGFIRYRYGAPNSPNVLTGLRRLA